MKTKFWLILLLFTIACNSSKKGLEYEDSSNRFYVTTEKSEKNGLVDTLYKFYDFNDPSTVREIGFYKDGFRNDLWNYNLPTEVKTIKWAYYKDKYLNFETNLFAHADSLKYDGFSPKFLFTTETGKVILSISVNADIKDSLPEKNYERITKNGFYSSGITPIVYNTRELFNKPNEIYIHDIEVIINASNEKKYIKSAFSFIDKKHFIEFSVSSSTENNFYANILFDAVLTNFVIDGKRLYNPLMAQG